VFLILRLEEIFLLIRGAVAALRLIFSKDNAYFRNIQKIFYFLLKIFPAACFCAIKPMNLPINPSPPEDVLTMIFPLQNAMNNTSSAQNISSAAPGMSRSYYWFLVLYLVLLSALGSFVNDMFTPALPSICRFFGTTASTGQLGLTLGMAGLAIGQILLGPVSDHYGRKSVLAYSIALFIAGGVAIVFSRSITAFILCRLLQGIGAAGGYFLARTVPADLFHGRPLAKLMALVGAINGIAPASAPVLGGIIADAWTWKGVFIVLSAFAAIILLLLPLFKESLPAGRRTTIP